MAKNAIEQIYDQLMQVFGGTNSNQMFSMLMPGTSLNPQTYAYDTTQTKPALVAEYESKLVDQMFDLTKVTGSSNGQRVSSQYLQALSVLVPNFNPTMPEIKSALRDFLNASVPDNTYLDGKPFVGSLQEYYFRLFDNWVKVKEVWEKDCVDKRELLSKNPKTEDEKYLEWYEQIAEGRLAEINEAYGKVLAVFAPSDMDALLGVLASGPGGEVMEASETAMNIRFASPNGGFFYPVDMVPNNWFLNLTSDVNPVDLLKDPQFIASTLAIKRQALQAGVSQAQMLLTRFPSNDAKVKAAAAAFSSAQDTFVKAQNNLLNTYTANTVTAINIYLSKMSALPPEATAALDAVTEMKDAVSKVSQANGDSDNVPAKKDGTSPLTKADIDALAAGQTTLIAAQSGLITSSQKLADAGMTLASEQAASFGDLPLILSRLQAQLAEVTDLQTQLTTSILTAGNRTPTTLNKAYPETYKTAANSLIKDVTAPTVITVALLQTAIDTSIAKNADPIKKDFAAIKTAATNASTRGVQPQEVFDAAKAKANEPTINIAANKAAIKTVLAAGTTALNTTGATAATVETAITGAVTAIADATVKAALAPVGAAATTAKNNTVASLGDVLNAVKAAAAVFIGDPVSKSSETSPGFMDLQLSFSTSEMTTASSESASFSQSSWGVDCFFGSVSSSSSSSSAYNSQSMFSSETEIKIGMKAAKVDIQRGWFNPGVFKLSKGMSRLSNMLVSKGPIDKTQSNLDDLNNAILPAFPVSFVIVKDVTMSFKVAESQLSAMHSVVDSKSATGGGFLCFSASSSSSSHSENSSMHSKTEGTVMTITMPNPQILGWFLETTPIDNSALMSTQEAAASDETINVINFIRKLKALSPKSV